MVARLELKGIDGRAPPGVELAAQFDSTRETLPGQNIVRIDRLQLFLDSMIGGAWPFLVGGVICLVNSDNERDPDLSNRHCTLVIPKIVQLPSWKNNMREHEEARGNNRSVMPLDALGCTCATMVRSTSCLVERPG